MIPSWKWTRKDCFSDIPLIEGEVKHPIFTVWRFLTSDSDVKNRQTKNERNAKTVAIASDPLFTMRFHRSLGIFVIIFTRFSLISPSILNRFLCKFAGTIQLLRVSKVWASTPKVTLMWNMHWVFQKLFRREFRRQLLNRFPCSFSGTSASITYFPVNLAKFD